MIDVKLKIDLGELAGLETAAMKAFARGISHGSEALRDHALKNHGLEAHGEQRYIRRSGELNRSIKQMPVTIVGYEIKAGIIATKKYSQWVEEGHDIKRGGVKIGEASPYPYMKPAMDDKKVQEEIEDIIADEVEKVFK